MLPLLETLFNWWEEDINNNDEVPDIIQLALEVALIVLGILAIAIIIPLCCIVLVISWFVGASNPKEDWIEIKDIWHELTSEA